MSARNDEMLTLFQNRAEGGDGQFAIAYALLQLAESHDRLNVDLCLGRSSGLGSYPGALEMVAISLKDIGERLGDSASAIPQE